MLWLFDTNPSKFGLVHKIRNDDDDDETLNLKKPPSVG